MGPYCQFCGRRCFLERVIPEGPHQGETWLLATCDPGMALDEERLGFTHLTAINPYERGATNGR